VEVFDPLAAPSVFNLVVFMLFSRYILLLLLHHTLLPPQVFVTSLHSCCSLGTLYCCYFIITLILLTFRHYVPYYHYLRNVVTSLSPYCCVLTSLYLASHYCYVITPRVVLLLCRTSCSVFLQSLYSLVPFSYIVMRVSRSILLLVFTTLCTI